MLILLAIGISGVALAGALDFLAGYKINFSFFYLAPVAFCTWKGTWRAGIPIALVSGWVAMLADVLMDKETAHGICPQCDSSVRETLPVNPSGT